jgi:hypothetical protein
LTPSVQPKTGFNRKERKERPGFYAASGSLRSLRSLRLMSGPFDAWHGVTKVTACIRTIAGVRHVLASDLSLSSLSLSFVREKSPRREKEKDKD